MYEKLVEQLGNYSKRYRSGETLGRAIEYTEDLLDEASAAIETLETLLQNYESAIDTKKRLAAKVEQLQSELEQVKRERDEATSCLRYSGECYGCLYAIDDEPVLCEACNESEENCNESCTWFGDPCGNCNQYEKDNWEWRGAREDKQNETD